jgi:cytochrome c oxidase subunit II
MVAELLWWMASGAAVIWLAVIGLAVYAMRVERDPPSEQAARLLILGGGAILPTVVLTILLAFGLARMPELLNPPEQPTLHVAVSGEEWWWRFRYEPPGEAPLETANELRLPVGAPVRFTVTTPDVIHSFWIPSLGPKIDLIPGRVNHLVLEPTRTGEFRGVCAEYCGMAHALMAFDVVVMEAGAFDAWLASRRAPAPEPDGPLELRGREAFLGNGCGACHTIRGTPAEGLVGPDLTHVGARPTLAAGILPNTPEVMRAWITRPEELKPGAHMPAFGMLPDEELDAIAAYLESLE